MGLAIALANQLQQMMIVDVLDFVSKDYKAAINLIQLAALEVISKLLASQTQCVTARVLAKNELRIRNADRLWSHDLVRQAVLEHSVLVNAGLVRKRIAPDDGLIRLHRNSGNLLEHLARRVKLFGGNRGVVRIFVRSHSQR